MSKLTKIFILTVGLIFIFGSFALAQEIERDEPIQEEVDDTAKDIIISPSPNEITADEEVALDETVEAADLEITEPTLLPDSPFYFLKTWRRGIRSFFTFGKINKANLKLKYASEKLLELRIVAEKLKDPEIIKKATANYDKEIGKIKAAADRIRETATENPKVGKFLDKFTKHQVLHQKVLEKLEEQVPVEAFEKIIESREKHLEKFGEVMLKLEEKTKLQTRLENNLEELKGSEFKQFKNLEMLKNLEEKAPEAAKEAIRGARENTLIKLKGKLEQMSTTTQQRFMDYVERIRGDTENKLDIIENLRSELKERLQIRERLEKMSEKILEGIKEKVEQMSPCSWVFKTKGDYYDLVHGFVNDEHNKFVISPSPNLKARSNKLNKNYFTISHGCSLDYANYPYVNPYNFVFCNVRYEDWSSDMSKEFLFSSIIDNPFEEFYFCMPGVFSIEELNEIIDNNELSTRCKKII